MNSVFGTPGFSFRRPSLIFIVGLLFAFSSHESSVALAANVTIKTSPTGLKVSVDGIIYTAPQTFGWGAMTQHTLAAVTPQVSGGATRYIFSSWSDGGAVTHVITAPLVDSSYTARFSTQYLLVTGSSPGTGGTIVLSPSSADGYYNSGTTVQVTAAPASGMYFSGWSGDLMGTANPTTITMSAPRSVTAQFTNVSGVDERGENLPEKFELLTNYPNPFNPSTAIRYDLPTRSQVILTVFNTLGQQVAVLQDGEQEAGYHEVRFDGSNLASGVYIYRMTAGSFVQSRKFLLLR